MAHIPPRECQSFITLISALLLTGNVVQATITLNGDAVVAGRAACALTGALTGTTAASHGDGRAS
jgi:hypothetical protein